MKRVTYRKFLRLDPYDFTGSKQRAFMRSFFRRKGRCTALDILGLAEIPDCAKVYSVLHEALLEKNTLQEFTCLCAGRALGHIEHPDPRSAAAIQAKRAWLRGEMPDGELAAAHAAALAAVRDSEGIGKIAAWSCVWASETHCPGGNARDAANDAAWVAAEESARAAATGIPGMAPWSAAWTCAWEMGFYAERRWQVEALKGLLQEAQP